MIPARISLTLMSGPRDGEILQFEPKPKDGEFVLAIGRRENCDICMNYDSQVSRSHAHLTFTDDTVMLKDLGSRNGTFVDDVRLEGEIEIDYGKLFRIGRTWIRLDSLSIDETQTARPIVNDDSDFF